MQQKENRILELDALRGIAALSVFFYHASIYYKESIYFSLFRFGLTGVDLFFIVSGFVIFSSIQNKTRIEFLKSRFLRLYPSYWYAVTFTFILIIIKYYDKGILNQIPIKEYLVNLTMIQEFFDIQNLDGPYWTLYIELFFYLIVFVFLKNERLLFSTLLIITSLKTISMLRILIIPDYLSSTPISSFGALFLTGMFFYKYKITKSIKFIMGVIACFLIQFIIYYFHYSYNKSTDINFFEHIVLLILYFCIFYLLVSNKLLFLRYKPLILLGEISYILYLIHQYFTTEIIEYYLVNKHNVSLGITIFLISLPIVLILSFFIHFIMNHFSKFLKKSFKL